MLNDCHQHRKATCALNEAQGETFTELGLYDCTPLVAPQGKMLCSDLFWLSFNVWRDTVDFTHFSLGSVVCVLNFVCFFWVTVLILFRGFFSRGQNTSGSEEFRTQTWSAP